MFPGALPLSLLPASWCTRLPGNTPCTRRSASPRSLPRGPGSGCSQTPTAGDEGLGGEGRPGADPVRAAEGEEITFLWKVPSRAATITVFPALAIASQNSTMSGNYVGHKQPVTGEQGQPQPVRQEPRTQDPTAATAFPAQRRTRGFSPLGLSHAWLLPPPHGPGQTGASRTRQPLHGPRQVCARPSTS